MSADLISALANVGTLVVVIVTASAAFVQLRHMSVLNGLTVLNEFRQEYERVESAAKAAMPVIAQRLSEPAERAAFADPRVRIEWLHPAMPLLRLFEILGSYTNRKIVPHEIVTDMWAPVIVRWWDDFGPLIAVMRRFDGPTMFENWEALTIRSRRVIASGKSSFPKSLKRLEIVDPWPDDLSAAPRSES